MVDDIVDLIGGSGAEVEVETGGSEGEVEIRGNGEGVEKETQLVFRVEMKIFLALTF